MQMKFPELLMIPLILIGLMILGYCIFGPDGTVPHHRDCKTAFDVYQQQPVTTACKSIGYHYCGITMTECANHDEYQCLNNIALVRSDCDF